MHKRRIGDLFAPELIVVEEVAVKPLDKLAQRRGQRALFGRALAVGETHRRLRITDMQRPDIRHDIAPRRDFDLHAQVGQNARHIGDGLLQRQVFARDKRATRSSGAGRRHQQRLSIGVEVFDLFNHKFRPGLHHLLHRAAVDGTQNALAILLGNIGGQLDLNFKNLVVAVFRVNNIVLRQTNILGRNIARLAVQLHKISRAQRRRRQKIIEWTRRRTIALVADRLIGHHREIIELGFKSKVVEKVDLNFHEGITRITG